MPTETLEDLFLVELKDVYDAEHRLIHSLTILGDEVQQDDVAAAFSDHESQTEGHVDRLESVFHALDEEPVREECQAMKGMVEETEAFMREQDPSAAVRDRYAVTAAQKAERYEITVYENLLQWANRLELDGDVTEALRENLDEEIQTLQKLQGIAEEFDYQQLTA